MMSSLKCSVRREVLEHFVARRVVKIGQAYSQYVPVHPSGYECNNRVHVLGNARSCVKGNRGPHIVQVLLSDAVPQQKVPSCFLFKPWHAENT